MTNRKKAICQKTVQIEKGNMSKNCEPFSKITNHMVCSRVKLKQKLNFFLLSKREVKTGRKHKTLYSLKVRHVLRPRMDKIVRKKVKNAKNDARVSSLTHSLRTQHSKQFKSDQKLF